MQYILKVHITLLNINSFFNYDIAFIAWVTSQNINKQCFYNLIKYYSSKL